MASQRVLEAKKAQALKDLADLTAENNRLLRLLCKTVDIDPDSPAPVETPVEAGELAEVPEETPEEAPVEDGDTVEVLVEAEAPAEKPAGKSKNKK